MPVKINGTTSGSVTLAAPATGSDVTLTLPGSAGTAALTTDTGLAFITSSTFSAVSSVSVNNCFTSTYENYRILVNLSSISTDLGLYMRMRASGSDNTTANYRSQSLYATSATVSAVQDQNSAGNTQWHLAGVFESNAPTAHKISVDLLSPQSATWTALSHSSMIYASDSNVYAFVGGNAFMTTTAFDGFSVITSTGTITGTIRVYGYRNS